MTRSFLSRWELFWDTAVENANQSPLQLYYRVGKKITEWRSYVIESRDGGHSWGDVLTLEDAPLGDYELVISGNSSSLAHERPFRLAVVERVCDIVLPVVAR